LDEDGSAVSHAQQFPGYYLLSHQVASQQSLKKTTPAAILR
jgi:hypothetical protein